MSVKSMPLLAPAALSVLCLLFFAPEVNAAPKSVHHICGDADVDKIQDSRSQDCIRQMEEDIKNGVSNPHYLMCLRDGGVSCCQDVGSSGARRCDRIFRSAVSTGSDAVINPTVSPGDTNGAKTLDTGKPGGKLKVQ
ncbi:MAG: hypothetical protein K8H74_06620 [Notoacmeibacter sp.]|nr:hypothetical protein [Notoacmeibacter sp.]